MTTHGIQENEIYRTSDFSQAIALYCLDFVLEAVDKTTPNRCGFLFKRTCELDRAIEWFWKRELRIEPQAYFQASKVLRTRLHDR